MSDKKPWKPFTKGQPSPFYTYIFRRWFKDAADLQGTAA